MFMKPFYESIQRRKTRHAVTNRFMTNTHGVPRVVLSQLKKSSKCFIRLNSDSRENMTFFFTFRTNSDTTEEIGLDVSRLKI